MRERLAAGKRYGALGRAYVPALAVMALAVGLALAPSGVGLEQASARIVDLALRRAVGREPPLDPRIKIFAYDDATLSMVGAPDLPVSDWMKVVRALSAKKPQLVVIDKIFAQLPPGEDLTEFLEVFAAAPVVVGAFVATDAIKDRPLLDLSLPAFAAENFLATGAARAPSGGFPYGPSAKLAAALGTTPRIGHANLEPGGARRPFVAFEGGRVVPSLPLLAAKSIRLDAADAVYADGKSMPIDHLGRTPGGFVSPEAVTKRSYSMRALIERARAGGDISVVKEADIVVILPLMFTGNADFFDSPYGRQPGGYFLVSDLNDVLIGRYTRPLPSRGILVCLWGVLGIYLGMRARLGRALVLVVAATAFACALGVAGFAFADVVSPWLPSALATLGCGTIMYLERQREETLRRVHVDAALETASALQMITIPPSTFVSPALKIAAAYVPADECAGDWWHHFELEGIRYVIVADATGHGVSAALISTASRAAVESLCAAGEPMEPAAILQRMGQVLFGMGQGRLTTCACAVAIDLRQGTMRIANSGLCFPLLVPARKDDDRLPEGTKRRGIAKAGVLTVRAAGSPLGLFDENDTNAVDVPLRAGDRLVIYSDGLTEANDPRGKQWGQNALAAALDRAREQDAPTILRDVLAALDLFREKEPFGDDVTVVVVDIAALHADMTRSATLLG